MELPENNKPKLNFKFFKEIFLKTIDQFIDDKGFKMAAALSYYAAFSIGPLLIIVISITGIFFGEDAVRGEITRQITYLVGEDSAEMIQEIIKAASNVSNGIFAGIVSLILLIFGSLAVFIELQESLNIIWGVEPKPGRGILGFLKDRLVSFLMVIASGILILISLLLNSAIQLFDNFLRNYIGTYVIAAEVINLIHSFIIITLLFALIFKYLPDVIISWRYVWFGALLTSFLFSIGKFLIGFYLSKSTYTSVYGTASSIIIIFLWIYFSAIILYFGSEFTQVYRSRISKTRIKPDKDGILVPKVSELIKMSMNKTEVIPKSGNNE